MSIEIHDRTLNPDPALTKRIAFGDPDSTVENITFQQLLDLFNGGMIKSAPIAIGVWNMDTTTYVDVIITAPITDLTKIRNISVIILNDADPGSIIPLNSSDTTSGLCAGYAEIRGGYIRCNRKTGGIFDNFFCWFDY